ncbi:asparagine synthase-related protein [Erythrobacter donghaensis]|uniref:asparagine synthase-related protein n=1 Tax=Erythrobacter donghaensis TaxID=267135 RepID=UPI000A3AF2A9|nr:asparagine synthase-related protein [Erythrobacter donghaensis]
MSGICAVLHCDGRPAATGELAPVLAALERRGPDGNHLAAEGPVALGHALLATTPEALAERQPLRHPGTGCLITADIRLDNRDDLIAALGLAPGARVIGDAELVLEAYLRWDLACLDHLRGDFAFALWDPRCERLLCARDQVGMRQLIYHHAQDRLFALATEAPALLRHESVPCRINEARIADYFEHLEAIDLTSTFFVGLHRLPPAHALTVSRGELKVWRYWQLTPPAPLRLPNDAAYAEAFRDVFGAAVAARLRSPGPVAAMLSGGVDSGSVAALAASQLQQAGRPPLATFSAIDSDPACVESQAIRDALGMAHLDPTLIGPGDMAMLRPEMERLALAVQEPFDTNMTLLRLMYLAGHRAGHRVMLDGGGGDIVLGAPDMVAWHLRSGRPGRACREARGQERFWGPVPGARENIVRQLARIMVPEPLRALRRRLAGLGRAAAPTPTLLSDAFVERIDLPARRAANARHIAPHRFAPDGTRAASDIHPYLVVGRERYDRIASALGIEPRDPFCDLRVIEFAASLPPDQLQDDGWPKVILRRAGAGLLPDPVRWRLGKEHLGGLLQDELWGESLRGEDRAALVDSLANLEPYVASRSIEHLAGAAKNAPAWDSEVASLLMLRYASEWLTINDNPDCC